MRLWNFAKCVPSGRGKHMQFALENHTSFVPFTLHNQNMTLPHNLGACSNPLEIFMPSIYPILSFRGRVLD